MIILSFTDRFFIHLNTIKQKIHFEIYYNLSFNLIQNMHKYCIFYDYLISDIKRNITSRAILSIKLYQF